MKSLTASLAALSVVLSTGVAMAAVTPQVLPTKSDMNQTMESNMWDHHHHHHHHHGWHRFSAVNNGTLMAAADTKKETKTEKMTKTPKTETKVKITSKTSSKKK